MWNAAEPAAPGVGLETIIPGWITDLGWVGLAILAVWAFATNRVYTSGQVDRLLEAERRVTAVWQKTAEDILPALERLSENLDPIVDGNNAVLRAIEGIKAAQEERYRGREGRRS